MKHAHQAKVAFTHRTSTSGGCRRNRTGPISAAIWRTSPYVNSAC